MKTSQLAELILKTQVDQWLPSQLKKLNLVKWKKRLHQGELSHSII
jgi:hypothetical protein